MAVWPHFSGPIFMASFPAFFGIGSMKNNACIFWKRLYEKKMQEMMPYKWGQENGARKMGPDRTPLN